MPDRVAFIVWGAVLGAISLSVTTTGRGFSFTEGTVPGQAILLGAGGALTLAATVIVGRPDRRVLAWLLLTAATAWFVAEWPNPAAGDVAFTVGTVAYIATPAVVFHVVVAAGVLRSIHSARALVGAGYLVMLGVVGLAAALTFDPVKSGCVSCPANLLDIGHEPSRWLAVNELGVRAGTVWTAAAILTVTWWLLHASAVQRREVGPLGVTALAYLILELAHFARGWRDGLLGSDATDRRLWQYQAAALVALAAASVADLVRSRRAERALTQVVSDLRAHKDIRAEMSARTRDPTLLIAYPAGGSGHVDAEGKPIDVTTLPGTVTDVRRAGTLLASVVHRPDVATDRVRELAAAVHLALDHERLRANALAQLEDIRRSGVRLLTAGDAERRRLERDLHDGAQQSLVALLLGIRILNTRSNNASPELLEAERLLESALGQLRDLAHGLHPVLLEGAGLATALQALAETRPLTTLELPNTRLTPVVESTLYQLVERVSRDRPASVAVNIREDAVALSLTTPGHLPELGPISDRVSTLDGALSCIPVGDAIRLAVTLPLSPKTPGGAGGPQHVRPDARGHTPSHGR